MFTQVFEAHKPRGGDKASPFSCKLPFISFQCAFTQEYEQDPLNCSAPDTMLEDINSAPSVMYFAQRR